MANYSEEFIKADNPWKSEDDFVCPIPEKIFDDKAEWLLKKDADDIHAFNNRNKDKPDFKFELGMRPEPFNGNPLKAKVIILSLNPGYILRVNNLFAKVLQTTEPKDIQEAVKEQKDKQLRLEAESFFCQRNSQDGDLVSYREAHCMLDDWYWYDIFNKFLIEAKEANYLPIDYSLDKIFDNIALVQYVGYMSKSWKDLPNILPSQEFTRKLIHYLAQKTDVLFIISRSEDKWKNLIGDKVWNTLESQERLVHRKKYDVKNKNGKEYKVTIRTQHFSQAAFDGDGFKIIADKFKSLQ